MVTRVVEATSIQAPLQVGDTIRVEAQGSAKPFKVSGLVKFGSSNIDVNGSLGTIFSIRRRRGAELVIPVLAKIPEASVLEIYAQQAAGWLRIEPAALLRDVQALKSGKPPPRPSPASGGGR